MKDHLHCQTWLWVVMKHSVYQFILAAFVISAIQAGPTHAQNLLERIVTIHLDQTNVGAFLNTLEKSTGVDFVYSSKAIGAQRKLSVHHVNQKLSFVLETTLKPMNIGFRLVDGSILLHRSWTDSPGADGDPDNFLGAMPATSPPDRTVTGAVTDEKGEGLPGVSVVLKGTQRGTVTGASGAYSISIGSDADVLVFSFVGYLSKEATIGDRKKIDIALAADTKALDEVMVVGYGTQKKSDLTGSVSSVKGSDLTRLPTQRVDQALQGRAAGVMVQNTDGAPGGNATIRVRGGNSITGGNNALVVVDGIQGVNITTINPNDIESLEVLKDASATAIYGARGANGVILITTKRGASGKAVFNYGFSMGFQRLNHKLDLMNAGYYARKSNDWAATQNGTASAPITPVIPFSTEQIAQLDANGGTDWQNEIYRSGKLQNHQLSVSGGGESARFFVSAGYMNQQGIVVNTKYARYNLRSNLDLKVTSWMNAGINLNVIKDKGNVPPVGEGTRFGDILGQVINTVARFDPVTPVYDANGNYNNKALKGGPDGSKIYADSDVWNPVATALETKSEKNNITNEISTFLDFKLLKGFSLRVTGAASINSNDEQHYYSTKTQPGRGVSGLGDLTESKYQYYQNSNILTYSNVFNKKHALTFTGVAEQQLIQSKSSFISAQGFFSDDTGINDLGGASQINERYNAQAKQVLNSFLGRVNYVFNDKYMITASYRADGSSVFGANNKWGYFPSAAAAWRVSQEAFLENIKAISNLKLRASWGKTGNQAIQPYQTLATVASGFNYPYEGNSAPNVGFALGRAANPNLKWETTQQTNVGMDLGFFAERLVATVDLYKKTTADLLLNKQVEAYTGFTTILSNVGSIQNKGLEISVGGKPLAAGALKWSTSANISFNRSKVLTLLDNAPLAIRTNTGGGYQIYGSGFSLKYLQVGQPVDQMRGYTNLGTWSEAERAEAKKMGQAPGEPKWKDVNGDGKITRAADGLEVIGNASPKFIYGWNNTVSYKDFDLTFLMQGSYGNAIFNAVRIKTENPSNGLSTNLKNRWSAENQNTDVPVFLSSRERNLLELGSNQTSGIGVDQRSSRWIEDGSYLRMKNVTLTYTIPTSIVGRIGISRLSTYVTGINLFTITKYTGYDPEVSSFNAGGAGGLGIDLSNYPTAKSLMFGLNLTF
ncbi:SusC/RagA family TonB-linked outer membrane protein [Dyadobacter pollutisoli]|uniref:TonB-dependent receptor n=1 Tax=Dyadobacter pollutisoli TaxID=2910158 RepID=A0A9E8NC53_9BACT|nr:TonB-dependent receptor [Dyadobacter pollutisoli]WAC13283.1 TonB-dependent receptor [Dyadobacter pollutisoli]